MVNLQKNNQLIKEDVFKKMGLEEGMKVGDLGCGNLAYYAFNAAKIVGKKGLVFAVDVLKSVLEVVNQHIKQEGLDNIKTVWSNLEILGGTNIPNESLDAAFIHNVLFQSTEQQKFLQETARLLKKGGKLMIIDWKKTGAPFGPPVKSRPDPDKIKQLAESVGLKTLEEFDAGPYHFGIIFSKA